VSRLTFPAASITQRFHDISCQPQFGSEAWPTLSRLVAKRSKRSRVSQHNLIKPEMNPSSVKFKMQLFAK